ncbi:hypothetical protein ACFQS7_10240 [Dankookia sp. GCM10030260]|uniref:hypothetical protein n=1 Tax=Dankookia sp. GCM10030260 TaxID=3273390 RepID=UPI00360C91BB
MRPILLLVALLFAMPAEARPDAASLEAARRFLCPNGGTPVRGQGGRCRAAAGEGSARGWDRGLPPPAHRQAACPEGTRAAEARARPEAVRCVPD